MMNSVAKRLVRHAIVFSLGAFNAWGLTPVASQFNLNASQHLIFASISFFLFLAVVTYYLSQMFSENKTS